MKVWCIRCRVFFSLLLLLLFVVVVVVVFFFFVKILSYTHFRNIGLMKFCDVCRKVQISPIRNSSPNALANTFISDTVAFELDVSCSSGLDFGRLVEYTQLHMLFFLNNESARKNKNDDNKLSCKTIY